MADPKSVVLVASDLGPSSKEVIGAGVAFAKRLGASVRLLHATHPPIEAPPLELTHDIQSAFDAWEIRIETERADHRGSLDAQAKAIREQGVEAVTVLAEGRPRDAILEDAAANGVEVVVVGPHSARGSWAERLVERLVGSTASQVVRRATCPVLVAEAWMAHAEQEPSWVVGVDLSDHSKSVLAQAVEWANRCGAKLTVLYFFGPLGAMTADNAWPDVLRAYAEQEARKDIAAWLVPQSSRLRVSLDVDVAHGDPGLELAAEAQRRGAELLVMGTHGRSGPARALLGSITEKCLRLASLPVLVVPVAKDSERTQ